MNKLILFYLLINKVLLSLQTYTTYQPLTNTAQNQYSQQYLAPSSSRSYSNQYQTNPYTMSSSYSTLPGSSLLSYNPYSYLLMPQSQVAYPSTVATQQATYNTSSYDPSNPYASSYSTSFVVQNPSANYNPSQSDLQRPQVFSQEQQRLMNNQSKFYNSNDGGFYNNQQTVTQPSSRSYTPGISLMVNQVNGQSVGTTSQAIRMQPMTSVANPMQQQAQSFPNSEIRDPLLKVVTQMFSGLEKYNEFWQPITFETDISISPKDSIIFNDITDLKSFRLDSESAPTDFDSFKNMLQSVERDLNTSGTNSSDDDEETRASIMLASAFLSLRDNQEIRELVSKSFDPTITNVVNKIFVGIAKDLEQITDLLKLKNEKRQVSASVMASCFKQLLDFPKSAFASNENKIANTFNKSSIAFNKKTVFGYEWPIYFMAYSPNLAALQNYFGYDSSFSKLKLMRDVLFKEGAEKDAIFSVPPMFEQMVSDLKLLVGAIDTGSDLSNLQGQRKIYPVPDAFIIPILSMYLLIKKDCDKTFAALDASVDIGNEDKDLKKSRIEKYGLLVGSRQLNYLVYQWIMQKQYDPKYIILNDSIKIGSYDPTFVIPDNARLQKTFLGSLISESLRQYFVYVKKIYDDPYELSMLKVLESIFDGDVPRYWPLSMSSSKNDDHLKAFIDLLIDVAKEVESGVVGADSVEVHKAFINMVNAMKEKKNGVVGANWKPWIKPMFDLYSKNLLTEISAKVSKAKSFVSSRSTKK